MICIDPGLRGCGVASFSLTRLEWAGYVKNLSSRGRGPSEHRWMALSVMNDLLANGIQMTSPLILEFPVIYPGVSRVDLNDLLDLAGVDGALTASMQVGPEEIEHVTPREWKGQVPKDIMNRRVRSKLDPHELNSIRSSGAKDHNTLDAVGIGLFKLGRL